MILKLRKEQNCFFYLNFISFLFFFNFFSHHFILFSIRSSFRKQSKNWIDLCWLDGNLVCMSTILEKDWVSLPAKLFIWFWFWFLALFGFPSILLLAKKKRGKPNIITSNFPCRFLVVQDSSVFGMFFFLVFNQVVSWKYFL